ncbi:MAG: C1 family peptidase [Flavobacteriales bacterium]|nr:C1 family peptidase [Flavobacteriales bacterium]
MKCNAPRFYRPLLVIAPVIVSIEAWSQTPDFFHGLVLPDMATIQALPFEPDLIAGGDSALPKSVDMSMWFPPAGDQGKQGSCVGWALAYGLVGYHNNVRTGARMGPGSPMDPNKVFSPAFLFNLAMRREADQNCAAGISNLENAIAIVCDTGSVKWKDYPYDPSVCLGPVPGTLLRTALTTRMSCPVQLGTQNRALWRYNLAQHQPIVCGVSVDSVFTHLKSSSGDSMVVWNQKIPTDSVEWATFPWSRYEGHFLVCAGYDDADSTYLVLSSWSEKWGNKGYARIPYSVMDMLCFGAMVVQNEAAAPSTPVPFLLLPWRQHGDSTTIEKMRQGQHHQVGDLTTELVYAEKDRSAVQLALVDSTEKVVHTVRPRRGQPLKVYVHGHLYTLLYTGPHPKDKPARPRISLQVFTDRNATDPHTEQIFNKVDVMEDGVVGNKAR